MTASPISVLVVDDNVVVRAGLVSLLESNEDLRVAGEAGDGAQAVSEARRLRPDVILLDVRMPGRDGVSVLADLTELSRVVMLTHTEDSETIRTALRSGAAGYLVHGHFTAEELNRALRDAVEGTGSPLSPVAATVVLRDLREAPRERRVGSPAPAELGLSDREGEILAAAARGLSNAAIAGELFLTEKTVKNHLNRIFRKLGVGTRAAAIARWNGDDTPGSRRAGP